MSPSHQVRVQQNNCDHLVATITSELGIFQLCLKCGKRKDTISQAPLSVEQSQVEDKSEHPYPDQKEEQDQE